MALSVVEEEEIGDARVHIRGTVHNLGDEVPRGFLQVATYGEAPHLPADESGRRELADWLASPENPLTARVIVNRAWHWLLGAGLVRTVDNFGTTGEAPSHPELLDTLAVRFMDEGWSIKSLVREIVLSRTYRLSTVDDPAAQAVDPENRLLWRRNRRRLEAECIRDAILAASGQLRLEMGGRTFPPDLKADYGFEHADTRRSVYAPVFRNALPELFEAFDFADPSMVVGRRDTSTVAPQALFLMNHPFVLEQSRAAARRLLAEVPDDDRARVDRAYRLILGRGPTAEGTADRAAVRRRPRGRARGGLGPARAGPVRIDRFPLYSLISDSSPTPVMPEQPRPEEDAVSYPSQPPRPAEGRRVRLRIPRPGRPRRRAGRSGPPANPLAPRPPHFAPKAKRVIFLFMQGGVSQVDSYDYKPTLFRQDGKDMPFDDARVLANTGMRGSEQRVMRPLWNFSRHGEWGRWASSLFPETNRHVDDLCFIHSLHTEGVAHGPATLFLHCGATASIRPSMGSWIQYGLGTENQDLPGFVTIGPSAGNGGPRNYGNAFLPAVYQGTAIGKAGAPASEATIRNLANPRALDGRPPPPARPAPIPERRAGRQRPATRSSTPSSPPTSWPGGCR